MWYVLRYIFGWLLPRPKARAAPPVRSLPKLSEVEFAKILARAVGGVTEYRLPDDSRVDILTDKHAVEVDWAHKWPEGIGQCLYYGLMTERAPVVLLLADVATENRFINRCHLVCVNRGIELWVYDWPKGKFTRNGVTTEVK